MSIWTDHDGSFWNYDLGTRKWQRVTEVDGEYICSEIISNDPNKIKSESPKTIQQSANKNRHLIFKEFFVRISIGYMIGTLIGFLFSILFRL